MVDLIRVLDNQALIVWNNDLLVNFVLIWLLKILSVKLINILFQIPYNLLKALFILDLNCNDIRSIYVAVNSLKSFNDLINDLDISKLLFNTHPFVQVTF